MPVRNDLFMLRLPADQVIVSWPPELNARVQIVCQWRVIGGEWREKESEHREEEVCAVRS
jgi:hypothetical protein